MNLLILRVSDRPTAASGFPDRLVEGREIRSVEGCIAATREARGETRAVQRQAQQDVVTDNHENFHSQLYFITVSGVILS